MENVNEVDLVYREQYVVPDTRYLAGASTGYIQGLKEFLQKPVAFGNGNFTSTDVPNQFMWALTLGLQNLFTNNTTAGASVWGNKVSGFLGIRATIRVHLIVNAQPFQQGRYFLTFWPCVTDTTKTFQRLTNGGTSGLITSTQLPRAEVDLCTSSEVAFDIPYVHLNTHMNLLSGEGAWGQVNLICYLPFATGSGGTQNAPWQVYMSLHDVDLVCPTKPITVAQMAVPKIDRKQKKVEEEIESGPISSFLNKVSTVSMYLGEIPLLSSYATPVSWCSALMAKSAAVFGWSKPRNEMEIPRMNDLMGQYQQNCDGVENAYSLGLFNTNKVAVMPSFGGTDIDEMSIDFIKQQPAYYTNLTFSTTNKAGDLLAQFTTAPLYFQATVGTSSTGVLLTPIAGIASLFQYYRGSLIFTFKMAKTKFHTGRLLIAFQPGTDTVDAAGNRTVSTITNINQTNYLHREFLDIQDCCEFEFTLPYVSLQPYNLVSNGYGKLLIYCLNPLQCPSSCSTTIQMAVEVRGAPDMEFFQPSPPTYFPSTVAYSQSDPEAMPRKKLDLGKAQQFKDSMPAQLCVGEKVTSIKQLVSRGIWSDASPTIAALRPFIMGSMPKQNGIYAPLDYYSFFCACYTFVRGGVIIRSVSPSQGSWCLSLDIDPSTAITQSYVRDVGQTNSVEANNNKFNSVYVPQYTLTHGRLCAPDQGALQVAAPFRSNLLIRKSTLANNSAAPTLYMMRSGADDTQFGFWIGFPPMQVRPKTDFA